MQDISDLISTVGFPIVVALLLIWQQEKMSESYIDIVNSLKELISDNTASINLMISRAKENDERMLEKMGKQGESNNEISQKAQNPVQSYGQNK